MPKINRKPVTEVETRPVRGVQAEVCDGTVCVRSKYQEAFGNIEWSPWFPVSLPIARKLLAELQAAIERAET